MEILISQSIQGTSKENEDVIGFTKNYCWVIDEATDLFNCKEKIGLSVSEYVELLSEEIKNNCSDNKSLTDILINSINDLNSSILRFSDLDEDIFAKLPTFAFVFCRSINNKLEYIILGDCYLVVDDNIITDNRISSFSTYNKNKINTLLKTVSEDKLETERFKIFQQTRLKANKFDGYPIGSLDPQSINSALFGTIENIKSFQLMSDGYFKYYDKRIEPVKILEKIKSDINKSKFYGKKDDASLIVGRLK